MSEVTIALDGAKIAGIVLMSETGKSRHFHLRGALGKVKREMFNGKEHLVVPVIALMEGVIHAVNAKDPEFVSEKVLKAASATWNGRPLVLGHPAKNGVQISANDPTVLEAQSFGTIFNTRMSNKRMLMDAFVDPDRAEKVGGKEFLKDLESGTPIEVSVGSYVYSSAEEGKFNGRAYSARWEQAIGDHLAFLPGKTGACSIKMGCGAHRAASEAPIVHDVGDFTMTPRTWKERFNALVEALKNETPREDLLALETTGEEVPDAEVHLSTLEKASLDERVEAVHAAVNAKWPYNEMAGGGTYAVRIYDDHVIVRRGGKELYSVDYTVENGTVTLSTEDLKKVKRVEKFVAAEDNATLKAACGCEDKETDMNNSERIAALIANPNNPVKCEKVLASMTDDNLKALETHAAEVKATTDNAVKVEADLKALQTKTEADAEKLRTLEANAIGVEELTQLRALAAAKTAEDAKAKTDLVATLKTAQSVISEERLNGMDLNQLRDIAALAKVDAPSYAGRGIPVQRSLSTSSDTDQYQAPDAYDLKGLQSASR